jgi:hypothetical protein
MRIERRDFLALRVGEPATLSCERLYMRFVDAQADGTTTALFEQLATDLLGARALRLVDTSWLCRGDLKARLDDVLAVFRSAGGRVEDGGRPDRLRHTASASLAEALRAKA